jgi:hypothetical protein
MKKQLINEAKRLQELAGINEVKIPKPGAHPKDPNINVRAIKKEMDEFYGIDVSEEDIIDWLESYHFDRIEDDEDYDGEFVFDTGEREDLYMHLEDQDLI